MSRRIFVSFQFQWPYFCLNELYAFGEKKRVFWAKERVFLGEKKSFLSEKTVLWLVSRFEVAKCFLFCICIYFDLKILYSNHLNTEHKTNPVFRWFYTLLH